LSYGAKISSDHRFGCGNLRGALAEEFWQGCLAGRSGVARITLFDPTDFAVQIAGELKGFNPEDYIDRIEARRMDRFVQLGVVASEAAVKDAGLGPGQADPRRVGVLIGSGVGESEPSRLSTPTS